MAKTYKMNLKNGSVTELSGTDSLPHPGNFPLGSVESRAAARAIISAGRFRPGDEGTFKCGCSFFVTSKRDSRGDETGGLVQFVLPKDFSELMREHVHDFEVAG